MSSNIRLRLGLLAGVLAAAPLWGQSVAFTISCPSLVSPGQDVYCSVNATPSSGTPVTGMSFGVLVAPGQAGTPDLDAGLQVAWDGGLVNGNYNSLSSLTSWSMLRSSSFSSSMPL